MKKILFGTVCSLVILGGVVALPYLASTYKNPTAAFWLVILGGIFAISSTILLAEKFGFASLGTADNCDKTVLVIGLQSNRASQNDAVLLARDQL